MKNKLVKGLLIFSLAGALSVSGVATMGTGLNEVDAAQIVGYSSLSAVTGIGYDADSNKIYWNKVPNAVYYEVTIGNFGTVRTYYPSYSVSGFSAGTYSITVKAVDSTSAYVVAQDVKGYNRPEGWSYEYGFSESKEVGNETYYSFYTYPSSIGTGQVTITTTGSKIVTNAISAMPGVKLKEANEDGIVVMPTSKIAWNSGERIIYEYSNNAEFKNDSDKDLFSYTTTVYNYDYDDDDDDYTNKNSQSAKIYFSSFAPGDTIYVRARVKNPYYVSQTAGSWVYGWHWDENDEYVYGQYWDSSTSEEQKYSPYSATLTYAVRKAKVSGVATSTTTNSVTLEVSTSNGAVTGYQFAKKVGSKWVTLDTQTDPCYVDSGLVKNTKYQYRVRAYTYNEKTKKTIWTDWYTVNTTTWGSNLNVKVAASSSTAVKVTWKPVSGAEGYEIYRYDDYSYGKTKEKGVYTEAASKKYLVKTIKKAKAKSFTQKKLTKNGSYTYVVRAYRTVGKQKVYLEGSASVNLRAGSLNVDTYKTSAGKVVATWSKQTGLKGYYVEQYDKKTGEYTTIKTLKASATSYTFPQVVAGSESVTYRIRPYDSTTVYDGETVTVSGSLAAPTNVKAVRTKDGVKVSWKAVSGADYYMVYRTKDGSYTYDKTTKTYSYYGGELVYEAAVNTDNCYPELGYAPYSSAGTYMRSSIRGTSVEDKTLTYKVRSVDENDNYIAVGKTANGETIYQTEDAIYVEGPEAGTTYHYYVVAYAEAPNGLNGVDVSSATSKASKVTYTNAAANKVSKITSVKSSKKGQATISYKKVKGVDGYAIYRSTKKNGTYVLVGTTTKTKFTDASAPAGKTCYYKVASYVKGEKKANIYSAKTAAKKVKIK